METSIPLKIQIQCMQQREHGTMSGWQCVQTSAKTATLAARAVIVKSERL